MKIVNFIAENIKRLVAVEISPTGNLVQITGKNGQGKSSVLDAIWWALASAKHIQAIPIREGATEARIRLDLGELIVTRKFRLQDDGSYTTSLTVENAQGAKFPSPQSVLDGLLGALTFDPLAFARSDEKEKFKTLRKLLPGIDFEAVETANKEDFDLRTDINRKEKEAAASAATIILPPGDIETVDEQALLSQLSSAGAHNEKIIKLRTGRTQAKEDMDRFRKEATEAAERAARLRVEADAAEKARLDLTAQADALKEKLDTAKSLPEQIDTSAVATALENARKANSIVALRDRKRQFEDAAVELHKQSVNLTARINKRNSDTSAAIAAANLPVKGLTIVDGAVLLNEKPFDQASDAEQLRASLAIAMAMNPTLRVIRVRDGSLLDKDSLQIVREMCDAEDYQVWMECVDTSGKVGFVLENGHVRAAS